MLKRLLTSSGAIMVYALVTAWGGYRTWMEVEGPHKISAAVTARAGQGGTLTLGVELPFPPETFHVEKLQQFGRIRRVRGRTVQIAFADYEQVQQLARRYYWVKKIDLPPAV
jgi:hypothetical protein